MARESVTRTTAPATVFLSVQGSLLSFAYVLSVVGIYWLFFTFTRRHRMCWAAGAVVCVSGALALAWASGPVGRDGPHGGSVWTQAAPKASGAD